MSHTDEPWSYCEDNDGWCIENGVEQLGILFGEGNARRIVACVNFCAGVSTEIIENSRCGEYQQVLLKDRDTYRELCGELLKVLVDAQNTLAHCKAGIGYVHRQTDTAIKLNAAITKAEQLLGEGK